MEKVYFNNIAKQLDWHIQIENREMLTKGLMKGMRPGKNLEVYIRSGDHNPSHFHVESKQRNYQQKFSVDGINNISTKKDLRFDSIIKKFFLKNSDFLSEIEKEFYQLNPNLVN